MTEKNQSDDMPDDVAKLHGIAFALAKELKPGEGGEEFAPFPEEVLGPVAQYLLELTEEEEADELVHACHTLAAFAIGQKPSSPTMAAQVLELLELANVQEALKKFSVSADPEKVKQMAEKFGNFAGTDSQKKAPKVGEEKPEGAVDLNALNFPKRL
jgi:hypothetical protein